jgi:hypothetical protein
VRARFLLAVLLWSFDASAQKDAPPEPVLEPPPTQGFTQQYQSVVRAHKPSPEWTQDRVFTSTRFWLLDPGNYEAQTWFRTRIYGTPGGTNAPTEFLLQQEVEIGLWPHLQIDLYENLTFNEDSSGHRGVQQEGVQIEARIAIPSYYGQIPTNPVIYLEFHPRHDAPDRAELRLLLGGAPKRWLYLAANPYVETNVENTNVQMNDLFGNIFTQSRFVADLEVGTTLAMGFRLHPTFTLSVETKIGGDMLGSIDNRLHFVWWGGPGFIWKPLPEKHRKRLKIMGTFLTAIPPTHPDAQRFEPLLIVGSQW